MDDKSANNRKSKRGRRRVAAGLRKHQQIDGVIVEEVFPLFDSSSTEKVGDGIYVSATAAGNKRFYGVMVDQSSLKEASTLFFQDQSDSLRLNERMKSLQPKQHPQQQNIDKGGTTNLFASSAIASTIDDEEAAMGNEGSTKIASKESSLNTSSKRKIDVHHDNNSISGATINDEKSLLSIVSKRVRLSPVNDSNQDDAKNTNLMKENSERAEERSARNAGSSLSKVPSISKDRPVQKFKYVEEKDEIGIQKGRRGSRNNSNNNSNDNLCNNYRILVATFSSVYEAACGDHNKAQAIYEACEKGGNFLSIDSYYYQYEILPPSLTMNAEAASKLAMIRTSMGFHSFLHSTALPPWYPLSNLYSQSKALNLLNMKEGDTAIVKCSSSGTTTKKSNTKISYVNDVASLAGGTRLSMQPRVKKQYQIGVIGGGIAGLACCQELVRSLSNDGIDVKVTLVEARSRLGGRIATDRSWKTKKNNTFPVELGASWIHGIDDNPLATLAQAAGVDFVRASEEVKMIDNNMKEVDSKMDEKMGKLFDELLDHATEDCWTASMDEQLTSKDAKNGQDPQSAVRWYASCFSKDDSTKTKLSPTDSANDMTSMVVITPPHRKSNDRSVDFQIGKVIAKHKFREFSKLTTEEHRMLLWNSKNVEYALGSNLDNLSMRYWDVDDRHAFEGDHVLLKEGYSAVIDHMLRSLEEVGSGKFEYFLNFPVGKVEYGRKTEREAYGKDRFGRERHLADLSDSCGITSEDGNETKYFDFLVSAVPLGVLKESVERAEDVECEKKMTFVPPLPFCKIDAIRNVGFGLLNKVYIQFPDPFWRVPSFFKDKDDCLFGNVTGVNPHHYMFFDAGKRLGSEDDSPAILMSLVSGKEAVTLEYMSDTDVIKQVIETLNVMFPISIPDPIGFRITRWGKDRFSRGSYTYLPPGSTDQDFQMLQSAVNASGDSLLIEGRTEAMRLFFAGEHTTALHPSVTHGAMLSGIRAAQEVVTTIQSKSKDDKEIDKVIPISVFKYGNPTTPLQCNLCHKIGGTTREGPLLAFKRGARQVLVHNNCAQFCPEVEVFDSKWKNVIRAVNRGKAFTCCHCSHNGATIGCSASNCYRMFHFSCAEDTGWRFDRDGKAFFCDACRPVSSPLAIKRCDRISTRFFMMRNEGKPLVCHLCRMPENEVHGELLAFQQGERQRCCVHLNCIQYTTIVKTFERQHSRMIHDYQNVFDVIRQSKICSVCKSEGASIRCANGHCDRVFHYHCAIAEYGWDFRRKGSERFRCCDHRKEKKIHAVEGSSVVAKEAIDQKRESVSALTFQHNLFAKLGATTKSPNVDVPGNLDISDAIHSQKQNSPALIESSNSTFTNESNSSESSGDDDSLLLELDDDGQTMEIMDLPLSSDVLGPSQLVRIERPSREDFWNISFQVMKIRNAIVVTIVSVGSGGKKEVPNNEDLTRPQAKDIVLSINGSKVGSNDLDTLRGILLRLKEEVNLVLEVIRTES